MKRFIAVLICALLVICVFLTSRISKLNDMSDDELIQIVLDNDIIWKRSLSSYIHPFGQIFNLRQSSPEFNELMTRSSGINSLNEFEPVSDQDRLELDWLLSYLE